LERNAHFDRASLALLITIGVCIGTNEALIRLDYFVEGYTLRAARTKSNKAHLSYSQKIHPTSGALHRNLVAQITRSYSIDKTSYSQKPFSSWKSLK
jgi:hypothetical protein